jgi:hypothetical protein
MKIRAIFAAVLIAALFATAGIWLVQRGEDSLRREQAAYDLGYLDNSAYFSSTCAAWAKANLRLAEIRVGEIDDYVRGCKDARAISISS